VLHLTGCIERTFVLQPHGLVTTGYEWWQLLWCQKLFSQHHTAVGGADAGAFKQEKALYLEPSQPLGRFLPQLHSIAEGEEGGLRDAHGSLMPPCIIMEKGEALDVWIANSGISLDLFTGLQVRPCAVTLVYVHRYRVFGIRINSAACAELDSVPKTEGIF
jgi:hypothetical protein